LEKATSALNTTRTKPQPTNTILVWMKLVFPYCFHLIKKETWSFVAQRFTQPVRHAVHHFTQWHDKNIHKFLCYQDINPQLWEPVRISSE
jgi:hypothetical protein